MLQFIVSHFVELWNILSKSILRNLMSPRQAIWNACLDEYANGYFWCKNIKKNHGRITAVVLFLVDLIGFEPTTPTMRMWCAPNCATGPNALSKTILYQENLKSKVFFEEKTGKILEAGREIEKPCVKNRKRSERFLRELLDSFGKMMYNTSQQSARYRIGVGHGRTSRGDSGALYLHVLYTGILNRKCQFHGLTYKTFCSLSQNAVWYQMGFYW